MTKVKVNRLFMALLAVVFFVSASAVLFPVRASRVSVGSSAFSGLNNITVVTDSADGLALTTKGRTGATVGVYSEATFANKLYTGNFSLKFLFSDSNFSDKFNVTLVSDPILKGEFGLVKKVENAISFVKKDGKLSISFNGINKDGNAITVASTATNFVADKEITVAYDATAKKLTAKQGTEVKDIASNVYITNDVAQVKFSFNKLLPTESAKLLITEINGQAYTGIDSSVKVDDNKAPEMVLDKNKVGTKDSKSHIYIRQSIKSKLPITAYDVVSSSISYEMTVEYYFNGKWVDAKKDIETTPKSPAGVFNGLEITALYAGDYRITSVTAKDGNGNETKVFANGVTVSEENPILITSIANSEFLDADGFENNLVPTLDQVSYTGKGLISCTDTNLFEFKAAAPSYVFAPASINSAYDIDAEYAYTYNVKYKTPTSSTWSKSTGLVFEAKNVESYNFYIEVVDRWGKTSAEEKDVTEINTIAFYDAKAPVIAINDFPETKYLDQAASLPSAVITDDMDSSTSKSIKVYYHKDVDGNLMYKMDEKGEFVYELDENGEAKLGTDGNKIKLEDLVAESSNFTPTKLGTYKVIYSAVDKNDNETTLEAYYFDVIEAPAAPKAPIIDTSNPWIIVSLCVAAASLLGIIAILFIKPKQD